MWLTVARTTPETLPMAVANRWKKAFLATKVELQEPWRSQGYLLTADLPDKGVDKHHSTTYTDVIHCCLSNISSAQPASPPFYLGYSWDLMKSS